MTEKVALSDEQIGAIMGQAQVFASAWSLVGGVLDHGDCGAEHAGPDALALGFIARLAGFKFRSRNPLYCWKKLTDLIGEAAQLIERIDRAGKGKE